MPDEFLPTVIVDTREQLPLQFKTLPSEPGTLTTGDYSIKGGEAMFSIERKSIDDIVMCCGVERERFERELNRLRGYHFGRLLIVGHRVEIETQKYRSRISPKAVMHTLHAFEVRYVPVVWEPTPEAAAEYVEKMAFWFAREILKAADNVRGKQ